MMLVVDEEAHAPRIGDFRAVNLRHAPRLGAEGRIERIAEGPPPALVSGDWTGMYLEPLGVRRSIHEADALVGRVCDGVAAPAAQTPVREVGPRLKPLFAILAPQVRRREIVNFVDAALAVVRPQQNVPRLVERAEHGVVLRGQFLEPAGAVAGGRGKRRHSA